MTRATGTPTTTSRSDRGPCSAARLLRAVAFAAPLTLLFPAIASEAARVFPVAPEDGAIVGGRPVFVIGFEPAEAERDGAPLLRLELLPRDASVEPYRFDQRRRKSGWMRGEPGRALFRPHGPLADGRYEWRVWSWDGVDWVGGDEAFELVIDRVPPAPPQLEVGKDGEELRLLWPPVAQDRDGGPEFVEAYRVYRFAGPPPFPLPPAGEVAVGQLPGYREPLFAAETLLFFRVVAQDGAGNRSDGLPVP